MSLHACILIARQYMWYDRSPGSTESVTGNVKHTRGMEPVAIERKLANYSRQI